MVELLVLFYLAATVSFFLSDDVTAGVGVGGGASPAAFDILLLIKQCNATIDRTKLDK